MLQSLPTQTGRWRSIESIPAIFNTTPQILVRAGGLRITSDDFNRAVLESNPETIDLLHSCTALK